MESIWHVRWHGIFLTHACRHYFKFKFQEFVLQNVLVTSVIVNYLTMRSVSSLNNPQNSEMKFCENMKFTC
jgi:hypothetical protein